MFICTSLGNSVPAKRIWMVEGQVRSGIKRRDLIKQLEQVKCIHYACLYACMQQFKQKHKALGDFTIKIEYVVEFLQSCQPYRFFDRSTESG